jgi:dienelactone hydrolase
MTQFVRRWHWVWLVSALALLAGACARTPSPTLDALDSAVPSVTVGISAPVASPSPSPTTRPALPASTASPGLVPSLTPLPATPAPLPPEAVEIQAPDQVLLRGTYYRAANEPAPLVVLVHQARGSQQDWLEMGYVQYLRNQGEPIPDGRFIPLPQDVHFAVFTFDLRGHGQSEGEYDEGRASQFMEDMAAALQIARRLPGVDPERVAAVGSSTGSAVLFRCPNVCSGVMSISLYPDEVASQAIQTLIEQGALVYCVSEFPCPVLPGERYVSVHYPDAGHGYDLLDPDLNPPPGQVLYDFLQSWIGFNP